MCDGLELWRLLNLEGHHPLHTIAVVFGMQRVHQMLVPCSLKIVWDRHDHQPFCQGAGLCAVLDMVLQMFENG